MNKSQKIVVSAKCTLNQFAMTAAMGSPLYQTTGSGVNWNCILDYNGLCVAAGPCVNKATAEEQAAQVMMQKLDYMEPPRIRTTEPLKHKMWFCKYLYDSRFLPMASDSLKLLYERWPAQVMPIQRSSFLEGLMNLLFESGDQFAYQKKWEQTLANNYGIIKLVGIEPNPGPIHLTNDEGHWILSEPNGLTFETLSSGFTVTEDSPPKIRTFSGFTYTLKPFTADYLMTLYKPPAPPLVGVEPNPGPPKKEVKELIKKEVKKEEKKVLQKKPRTEGQAKAIKQIAENRAKRLKALPRIPTDPKASKHVQNIMLTICTPCVRPTMRYNSAFTADPTAIAMPYNILDVAWPLSTTTALPALNADSMFGALYRDPVRAAILYDSNTGNDAALYNYVFDSNPDVSDPAIVWRIPYGLGLSDLFPNVACFQAAAENTWNPHGTILGSGKVQEKNGLFYMMTSGEGTADTLNVTPSGLTSYYIDICLWRLVGNELVLESTTTHVNGSTNIAITSPGTSGYRCFSIRANSTDINTAFTITAAITSAGAVFAHIPVKDLALKATVVDSMRIMGASIMFSDTSSTLNLAGQVTIAQVPPQKIFDQYLSTTNISAIQGSKTMDAKTGAYGFLKPVGFEDFEFIDFNDVSNTGVLSRFEYPVLSPTPSLVCFIQIGDSTLPQTGKWTISHAIEFQTQDMWFPKWVPTGEPEVFTEALNAVKAVPQFHENPLHWKDILGVASKIADFITTNGPKVVDWAGKIGSFISAVPV